MISPLREELGAVLADPVFARSPALSRLLGYLVQASARGEGASLKSYTVAVEGLGKSPDFDPQIDTSARVLVARLRRALDAYYAGPGAERPMRLAIGTGSYEVRLEENPHFRREGEERPEAAAAPVPRPAPAPVRRWRRPFTLKCAALLLLAAIAGGIAAFWLRPSGPEPQWTTARFPYVHVEFEDDGTPLARGVLDAMRPASIEEIGRYEVIRAAWRRDAAVNYVIRLRAQSGTGLGVSVQMLVVDLAINRIVYSRDLAFASREQFDREGMPRLSQAYYDLLGYRGVIVSQERKRESLDQGAYGCWLRFSADTLTNGGIGDRELEACAAKWHGHAPDHPVATAIYGWTLTNSTFGDLSAQSRKAKLDEAVAMLERARALNPDSRHILISLARTYAFMGDIPALQEVAARLEQKSRFNPDILNSTGTFLVLLRNDPGGMAMIDRSLAQEADPPGRYYVAPFVAAMMKDDLAAARAAVAHLNTQNHTSALNRILQAAYESRSGNLGAARASWDIACEQQPVLKVYPAAFLMVLPASAQVKDRLREWLRPAVPGV